MKRNSRNRSPSGARDRAVSTVAILSILAIAIAIGVTIAALGIGEAVSVGDQSSPSSDSGTLGESETGTHPDTEPPPPSETEIRAWEDWFRNLLATAQESGTTDVELRDYELNQNSDTVTVTHTPESGDSHNILLAVTTIAATYQHMVNYTIHHEQPVWRADLRGRIVRNGTLIATYHVENEWTVAFLRDDMGEEAYRTRYWGTLELINRQVDTPEAMTSHPDQ